ncbi:ATP-binding cassette domain-containing protein [Pseudoscardovia radai]|uniref:ATP-binding cassette domain-containing protein n=1 Tax=Pseudoscardovia radai TaxID=987066 RepID=UPI0039928A86
MENASYRYRDAAAGSWALRHVSLTVRRGEFVALTGRNGMGKSTLATLLCGVDAPTEGTVRVFGTPTATARQRRSLRGRVGYVMQHPERQLFAEHVEDDIAFGPTSLGLPTSEVRRRVQAAMDLLGIAHLANRVPWELSGGQQRLVAIAGVVAMEPEAIVLDEPTAGLDLEAAARVLDALRALHAEGRTIVMITHGDTSAASRTIRLGECTETDTRAGDARTTDDGTTDDGSADATTPSSADAPHRTPAQNRAPLARLDPRALIIGTLAGMVGMFFVSTPLQLLWAFLGVCAVVALSPRSLRGTLRNCHGMLASVLVLGLLNVFFVRSGTPLAHIGSLPITDEGMRNAVIYSLRFVFVLVLGLAMTVCTTPTKLTDAGAAMLSPLSRLGVHVDEISLVMSLALRFMPVMGAELRTLSIAQATRGGDVASGSPAKRCRAVMALIVPMFAAALRHAEMLGTALDARCYEGGAHRTHWHRSRWGIHDAIALLAVAGWMTALLLLPRLVTILAA